MLINDTDILHTEIIHKRQRAIKNLILIRKFFEARGAVSSTGAGYNGMPTFT